MASCLLVAALCVGAVTTVRELQAAHRQTHSIGTLARVGDRIALFRDPRDRFVDFVRSIVPPHATVQIRQPLRKQGAGTRPAPGPAGICGNDVDGSKYWLLVYFLAPRASVCDARGAWTIYFGVTVPSRPGVRQFSPTLGVAPP